MVRDRAAPWVPAIEPVGNRPIAHHVLEALETAGVEEVVVASSERSADQVQRCLADRGRQAQMQLEFVQQPCPLDFSSAITLAAPIVRDAPCIVHAAGGLLAEPLAPFADCLNESPDALLMVHQTSAPDRRLTAAAQSLLHLAELDPERSALGVAGVWAFGPGALRSAAEAVGGNRAGPDEDGLDLALMAERIASAGGMIHLRLVDAWRAYRGEAVDLLELNRIVLDQIKTETPHGLGRENRIEGRVAIDESAFVGNSVLVGPVVIGPNARVSDAYIGPYTSIGADAHIEGAEIERSIISTGASVTHVGARVTSSVIGRNARVRRDFSLPRAIRMRVGEDAEIGLC